MTPTLSILICSLESRVDLLGQLLTTLGPQLTDEIELLIDADDGKISIGSKRNALLHNAKGEYVCYIDDDDRVPEDYIAQILSALETRPDCVGFNLAYYVDGVLKGTAIHSLRFQTYGQRRNGRMMEYERTPNHLNPIRRELALQAGFTEKNHGEDTDFAVKVRPLLQTEVFVDKTLYHYLYNSKK